MNIPDVLSLEHNRSLDSKPDDKHPLFILRQYLTDIVIILPLPPECWEYRHAPGPASDPLILTLKDLEPWFSTYRL